LDQVSNMLLLAVYFGRDLEKEVVEKVVWRDGFE
jgi:hypothetical protein